MKSQILNRIEISTAAALLVVALGCGKSTAQPAAPAAPTTPAAPATAAAVPAGSVRYDAQPGGETKCSITGSSTIHDWTMDSAIITGSIICDAKFPESALTDAAAAKPEVKVSMPVRSFKSGKASMDQRMQDELSATNYTKFEYRLIELKPKSKAGDTGALQFDAVGALTVVGQTITNTMPVTIENKGGKLKIAGTTPLKFTDFKLKPPTINLLGIPTLSVGPDLKITFEWSLVAKAAPKP